MACEKTNRICYTMELDEKYASVILRRYVEDTGDVDNVFTIRNGVKLTYSELVKEVEDAPGFIDCAGIASPGLTSSPAIGCMVADIVKEKLHPEVNPDFDPVRKGILDPSELSLEERNELIKRSPEYGNIICRCEMISEGEILDAIRRPLGAKSLDGVKRRTRAGMGRCQSGFCSPRTMEILSRELGISMEEITKTGGASRLIEGINKKIAEEGENHE